MKKNKFITIVAAASMLSACYDSDTIKSDAQEQQAEQTLTFSAFADKVTKGSNSTALQDFYPVFSVYGWKTVKTDNGTDNQSVFSNTPNEFFNEDKSGDVVYASEGKKPSVEWVLPSSIGTGDPKKGYWYYEDVRYWDKMATSYQFFAIAPYATDGTKIYNVSDDDKNFTIATPTDKYDISTEKNLAQVPQSALTYSGYNKDFMIAEKKVVTPDGTTVNSDVQLVFHHILTKLNVQIKKDPDYKGQQELKVNILKIANLKKTGYFKYNGNTTSDGMTNNGWTTDGKYDINITTPYSLTATTNYNEYYWVENLIFPQSAQKKAAGAQPTAQDLTDIYLYIQYQIGDEVFNAYYDFADIWDSTLAINEEYEFKQGSQYNLTLTVGPKPIHFDAEVFEWTTENAGSVTID